MPLTHTFTNDVVVQIAGRIVADVAFVQLVVLAGCSSSKRFGESVQPPF